MIGKHFMFLPWWKSFNSLLLHSKGISNSYLGPVRSYLIWSLPESELSSLGLSISLLCPSHISLLGIAWVWWTHSHLGAFTLLFSITEVFLGLHSDFHPNITLSESLANIISFFSPYLPLVFFIVLSLHSIYRIPYLYLLIDSLLH